MSQTHETMMNPPIETLLGEVDSKFSLVTLAARRARNINTYYNRLGDAVGNMVPPQVPTTSRKPLSIAFEEIAEKKIQSVEAPDEVVAPLDLPEGEVDVEAEASADDAS